jgi:hypothetical protein
MQIIYIFHIYLYLDMYEERKRTQKKKEKKKASAFRTSTFRTKYLKY